MAEWMTCPGCHLRHSRRPDGLCPRCKQSVDGVAEPPSPEPAAAATLELASSDAAPAASPSVAGLGRLSQAARGKELKSARAIMWFVGVVTLLLNGYFFSTAAADVQTEIDKEIRKLGPSFVVDQAKLAAIRTEAVRAARLINGGGMLLGAIFIACGLLVVAHPVPSTVTALALYLGGNAIFGMINPASLGAGFIMKIFIVIALFKAVQAAIAYRKEQATTAEA